ncbi:MAG: energy transducer TonB [Gemmatimonadota bacterium]|nr:energy transducer TonB [Gemmatimonadota bacterium]
MPDSAQMSTMMAKAMRRLRPAQFVLDHRAELALTPEQIPFIESLALAQIDSERARAQHMLAAQTESMKNRAPSKEMGMMEWTGTIDEDAIRASAQRSVETSIAYQIGLLRDRHLVGAVLTPAQISTLKQLEMRDMMGGLSGVAVGQIPAKGGPYFEFQVDKPAAQVPGSSGVKYPEALRTTKLEGDVLAQFVVDSAGRYEEGTFHVLQSPHELFTQAIRDALPQMRFTPAELGGARVRQLVQQKFVFSPSGVK